MSLKHIYNHSSVLYYRFGGSKICSRYECDIKDSSPEYNHIILNSGRMIIVNYATVGFRLF